MMHEIISVSIVLFIASLCYSGSACRGEWNLDPGATRYQKCTRVFKAWIPYGIFFTVVGIIYIPFVWCVAPLMGWNIGVAK